MGFYFLPFADEHLLPRVCLLILSYMQYVPHVSRMAEKWWVGAGFADVSAGLSRPRRVRHSYIHWL